MLGSVKEGEVKGMKDMRGALAFFLLLLACAPATAQTAVTFFNTYVDQLAQQEVLQAEINASMGAVTPGRAPDTAQMKTCAQIYPRAASLYSAHAAELRAMQMDARLAKWRKNLVDLVGGKADNYVQIGKICAAVVAGEPPPPPAPGYPPHLKESAIDKLMAQITAFVLVETLLPEGSKVKDTSARLTCTKQERDQLVAKIEAGFGKTPNPKQYRSASMAELRKFLLERKAADES
jgi:hypothetical protein